MTSPKQWGDVVRDRLASFEGSPHPITGAPIESRMNGGRIEARIPIGTAREDEFCGDIDAVVAAVEVCECGKFRQAGKPCGRKREAYR